MTSDPWRIEIMPSARRDLNRLKEAAASAVLEAIDHIADAPHRLGKPLRLELEGVWSARRGTYRVVYRIDESKRLVQIITIDHRADVYRRARRG
ncbi:MAG TPA: type II toxin-antitoxin system RelE/ParE family toxin [Chloroflexota bacterium]|nr:type II toxin-antitoxin system RelE/ParE family toxin [Chloroflexota bacterium]